MPVKFPHHVSPKKYDRNAGDEMMLKVANGLARLELTKEQVKEIVEDPKIMSKEQLKLCRRPLKIVEGYSAKTLPSSLFNSDYYGEYPVRGILTRVVDSDYYGEYPVRGSLTRVVEKNYSEKP